MAAYKRYLYRVLNKINLINNDSARLQDPEKAPGERRVKRQSKAGDTRSFDNDHPSVLPFEKNLAENEEHKKTELSENKLPYSPFWFWNNNIADELALEFIREGETDKAIAIWEKAILTKDKRKLTSVVLVEDLITESSNWIEEKDEYHSLIKTGDEYTIFREKKTGSSVPCVPADLNYEDSWTIEVDTQWFDGVDKYSYGIIFGREQSSYYCFVITGNGHFSLVKQTKGDYHELIPWKKAFAINKCSANHLLIKKIDSQISLYINNNYVGAVQSEPFFGKSFGFKVWGNQKVSFKKFKLSRFIEDDTKFKVTNENYSCVKNLSMLYLGLATRNGGFHLEYFKRSIELAKLFYASGQNEGYAKLIEGERYFYYPEKTLHFYLTEVIDSIKKYVDKQKGISTSDLISLFSTFSVETKQLFNNIFFSNRIQKIEREIEIARAVKKNSSAEASDAGKKLIKSTREDIGYLKNFLSEDDQQYAAIADKLASEIMQCGIDFYSHLFDIDYKLANNNIELYLPEHKYALSIAVSNQTKDRLKEILNLYQKKIKENKDKGISKKGKKGTA